MDFYYVNQGNTDLQSVRCAVETGILPVPVIFCLLNLNAEFGRFSLMKHFTSLLLAAVLAAGTVFAQRPTFDFLRIDASARAAALNGSFVSMKDDPNGLFYNPATIGTVTIPRVSLTYMDYLMDVSAGTLSLVQPVNKIGNIGFGVMYINYGSFDRTDEDLNTYGKFGAGELACLAGIAINYDKDILIGINAKYIYSSIAEYSSYALAFDLGFLYEIASENLTIGGSILNIGSQFRTYGGTGEPLPKDVKLGITKRPEHLPVYLNIVFHRLNEAGKKFTDRFSNFTFGAEFIMSDALRLRAGYNNKLRRDMKMGTSAGLAGFSFGGGLVLQNYLVDYSYNSIGKNIDGLHRFSLGINISNAGK
jgi:hypothetical protein